MNIVEGDIKSVIDLSNVEMEKVLKFFEKDILSLRTGKASISLVDMLPVEAHGQTMKIRDVASISISDARSIVINPWDKTILSAVAKSITNSDLGVNPMVDGDILRVVLPMMSSERREEFIKLLSKKLEDAKIKIRNIRRDFMTDIKKAEKSKDISQDFMKVLEVKLQESTDSWIGKLDETSKKKEVDLRVV